MTQEKEKAVLVHWYYSVEEWETFSRSERKKKYGKAIAAVYISIVYCFRTINYRWIMPNRPETVITNGTATINGKPTVFHGNGKWLRKVDIQEKNNLNVLAISYEWNTTKGTRYDELHIPVPKGKLREAMELVDSLDYPGIKTI